MKAPTEPTALSASGRSSIGLADQVVYTTTNLLMSLAVARFGTLEEFGRFSLLYLIVTYSLSLIRARYGQPLLFKGVGGRPSGASIVAAGALFGVVVGVVGVAIGSSVWLPLAIAVPVVCLQDVARHIALARRQVGRALRQDVVWLTFQVAVLAGGMVGVGANAMLAVVAWGVGAFASVLVGMWEARTEVASGAPPKGSVGGRPENSIGGWLVADVVAGAVKHQSVILIFASLAGWGAAGAFRLCVTVLGFIPILHVALLGVIVPDSRERGKTDAPPLVTATRRASIMLVPLAILGMLVTLFLDRFGIWGAAFGKDTWAAASILLPVVVGAELLLLLEKPLQIGLLAVAAVPKVVILKAATGLVFVSATLAGTLVAGDALGGVWGQLVAGPLTAPAWLVFWFRERRSLTV